jgi:hypothetical protein
MLLSLEKGKQLSPELACISFCDGVPVMKCCSTIKPSFQPQI